MGTSNFLLYTADCADMAAGTLYTYPQSFRANKVLIASQYSGANVKVDSGFKIGETNKSADFLKKFPCGKVPAFEGSDGFLLSESNAIAYYVANAELQGADQKAAAQVQQWISFSDNEILPAACTWVFPCLGITQYNKQDTERAKEQVKKVLNVLNNHFLTRTFVVGERVTLADISLVCNLQMLYEQVLDDGFRKAYQNVNRWFTTMINQPNVKKVLGDVKLCTKMAQFDAKKYQELHGGSGDKKKDKKAAAPKQEKAKPKEAPKPKAAEPEEPPKAKEPKDPFASEKKGTMDLDAFKRCYSNSKDIAGEAVPHFWENFDKEAYSIWVCDYVEPLKGKMKFQVANLIGGFFQRLDKLNKNAFARMIVTEGSEEKDWGISGLWFWRSQELAFKLSDNWQVDYESYTWKKLDADSDETKELVKAFFVAEEDQIYNGRTIVEEKTLK